MAMRRKDGSVSYLQSLAPLLNREFVDSLRPIDEMIYVESACPRVPARVWTQLKREKDLSKARFQFLCSHMYIPFDRYGSMEAILAACNSDDRNVYPTLNVFTFARALYKVGLKHTSDVLVQRCIAPFLARVYENDGFRQLKTVPEVLFQMSYTKRNRTFMYSQVLKDVCRPNEMLLRCRKYYCEREEKEDETSDERLDRWKYEITTQRKVEDEYRQFLHKRPMYTDREEASRRWFDEHVIRTACETTKNDWEMHGPKAIDKSQHVWKEDRTLKPYCVKTIKVARSRIEDTSDMEYCVLTLVQKIWCPMDPNGQIRCVTSHDHWDDDL